MSKPGENRPASLWPLGTRLIYLDAWGRNPVEAKVTGHFDNPNNIRVEDDRGIVYFGQTWRIATEPPKPKNATAFDDLLGDDDEPAPDPVRKGFDFEDLLS